MKMLSFKLLNKFSEITNFCTTRHGGVSVGTYSSLNMSPYTGDEEGCIQKNREILCLKVGLNPEKIIIPFQTHSTEIREINQAFLDLSNDKKNDFLHGVDGLVTQLPHVCLGITTADCVPLLFYDPQNKVIAAVHAGWRGTCNHIGSKTVHTLIQKFGTNPANIVISIGPSISKKAYQVGTDVVDSFKAAGFKTNEIFDYTNQGTFLDLWKAVSQDLIGAGITESNIEISGICTYSQHEDYFSARKLGIKSGRMLSGIMLKN